MKTSTSNIIIVSDRSKIKGLIVSNGILLKDVAKAARMGKTTFSNYLSGRLHNRHRQFDIVMAFRKLSGLDISEADFWGGLLSNKRRNER